MRQHTILFFSLLFLGSLKTNAHPLKLPQDSIKSNIVKLFNQLPAKVRHNYTVYRQEDIWMSLSTSDYPIDVTVDNDSNYLCVQDEGTGGGSCHLHAQLYENSGKQQFVAINCREFDGVSSHDNLQIFLLNNLQAINKSQNLIPQISYHNFLPDSFDTNIFAPDYNLTKILTFNYNLHEGGLSISPNLTLINMYCQTAFGPIDVNIQKQFCNLSEILSDKKLIYYWDKSSSQFITNKP